MRWRKVSAWPQALVLCLAAPGILVAQPDRIGGTIDSGQTIPARGIAQPLAQPRYDQGQVEGSFRLRYIQLVTIPTPAQQSALDELLAAQRDPTSPQFRRWLTPEQYADRFGLSRRDLAKISAWLSSAGFSIEYTARGRNWIAFSGTTAQVEGAFHTAVHRYVVNGEAHYAISSEPLLPAAIAPLVGTLLGLDDFNPKPPSLRPADTSASGAHSLAPADLATIYDINPLYQMGVDGTGQKIAIVGVTDLDPTDIQTFRSTYGLSPANIQTVLGGADPGTVSSALVEADLDLEWAGAIARNATLIYVYSTNFMSSATYAIDQNLAPIISQSYGGCEARQPASYPSTFETIAKQGNSQGITWVADSGDSGAADCDSDSNTTASDGLAVHFPASIPEVTAVGGSEFNDEGANYWSPTNGANGGSALGYIPEMAWNDSVYGTGLDTRLGSTGGGSSIFFARPSWQKGPGVPANSQRNLPDIALAASADHDAYNIVIGGLTELVGGTSASTPVFAGILALLNQYTKTNGLGNINATLYSLAVSSPAIFHDITIGSNVVPCAPGSLECMNGQLGYNATPGYNLATGLGSVDVYNLVTGWNGPSASGVTISSLSPASVTAGAATFTLTVNGSTFASAAVVQWNGATLPTTFVSPGQLTATVGVKLVAAPATAAITVSSGATVTGPLYFTAVPAPVTFSKQFVVAQAPSGCSNPPGVTFFATNMTAYLFFVANVSPADVLSAAWLAPDGTTIFANFWPPVSKPESTCLWTPGLSLTNVPSSQFGTWSARVYVNEMLLFSVQFTVTCTPAGAPAITFIDLAGDYGGYAYFASGSWLEIKGTNLADPADPRNPGQWTANDFNGVNAPTSLDGVSVSINGKPAYVWYLSTGQLNVQAPEDSATGNVPVTVATCKGTSSQFNFARQALAPGLLAPSSFNLNGKQYLVATFASDGAYVLSASAGAALGVNSRAAKPGDLIIAYGIGFGDVTPPILPGVEVEQGNTLTNAVTFSFGSAPANVSYAGLAPNFVGLYEFYITAPAGLANGDYQINATQNGAPLPQTLFLTVQN
ncbi:MAG TPA: protease pro-enzyme activation domain-containing protein [Bryobacteraceae bacterium]